MTKTEQVAASNYFDESIFKLVTRAIGTLLDENARENIADACSKAFMDSMEREAREL